MGNIFRTVAALSVLLLHTPAALAQPQQQPPPTSQTWGLPGQEPQQAQQGSGTDAQNAQGWGTTAQQQQQPQQQPPPAVGTTAAVESAPADEAEAPSTGGWLIRARLPSAFPLGFVPHAGPQLELGLVLGDLQLHVGLAVTTGSYTDKYEDAGDTYTDSVSLLALIAAPGVSYTTFESADHRARMLLQGRALIGTLSASQEGSRSDSALAFGLAVAALGEYRVHRTFGTGIEAGYGLVFVNRSEGASSTTASMTGLFVAFTGTLYLGGS